MNEIKRMQQLAGILTEIKVNNPNEKPLKVEITYEDGDGGKGIEYSDIGVGGFYYEDEDNISSLFNISEEEEMEDYDKLIALLDKSSIKDYNIEEDENSKIAHVPLKYINFKD